MTVTVACRLEGPEAFGRARKRAHQGALWAAGQGLIALNHLLYNKCYVLY